jgi:hypothetical protein
MFKTLAKIALFIIALSFLIFSGCAAETKFKVSGGPDAADAVTSNGGMVVQKGDYIYYINGLSTTSSNNKFGEPVKGSIVRMNLNNPEEKVIVVPKVVLSSYNKGGFYIFGNKIYYTSPSNEKDKNGNILSSYLDFFSVNLDGSGTKKILYTVSNSFAYKFFERDNTVYLIYADTNATAVYLVNTSTGNKTKVIEKYTGTPIFAEDENIYYTRAVYKDEVKKDSTYTYNRLFRISFMGGAEEEIKYSNGDTITQNKFSVTLSEVKVFGTDTVLYYTKKSATDIPDPVIIPQGQYCFKLGGAADFELFATSSEFILSNIVYLSEKTLLASYTPSGASTANLYWFDCSGGAANYVSKILMLNPAKILAVEGDYIYYLKSVDSKNVLYKKQFKGEGFEEGLIEGTELLKDVSFTTSGLSPEIISYNQNDYIYFVRADGDYINYIYRFNMTAGTEAENISIIAEEDKVSEE